MRKKRRKAKPLVTAEMKDSTAAEATSKSNIPTFLLPANLKILGKIFSLSLDPESDIFEVLRTGRGGD